MWFAIARIVSSTSHPDGTSSSGLHGGHVLSSPTMVGSRVGGCLAVSSRLPSPAIAYLAPLSSRHSHTNPSALLCEYESDVWCPCTQQTGSAYSRLPTDIYHRQCAGMLSRKHSPNAFVRCQAWVDLVAGSWWLVVHQEIPHKT